MLPTPEFRALIIDIARGGVALRTDWWAAAGAEVQVLLPGTDAPVGARTARTNDGVLALAFRQDEAMLRQVDASLSHIGALAERQAGGVSRMRRLGMNFRGAPHSARSAMAVPT